MAPPRPRSGRLAALLLAVALVGGACSSGSGSDDDAASTTTEAGSQGGPTTTTADDPTAPEDPATSPVADGIRILVLSSQPDRASGPEARVRVIPERGSAPEDLTVTLGPTDVTGQLRVTDGYLEGVVTGLVEGTNTLEASAGEDRATQRIRSWPLKGPMISGPHLPLLACSTEEHGLGAPSDADCSAPTTVTWRYVSTAGDVKDLPDPTVVPADVATTDEVPGAGGEPIPLLIRYEVGVVNRSIYEIASLDPTPGGTDTTEGAAWNRRLVYRYGDGCGTTYGQGTSAAGVLAPDYLRQGYVVATATFNTGAVQCNDVLSAETTMMVEERIIEEFGEPDLTIGEGTGFGGAQVHLILQNYPGLLDGALAVDPLPDIVTVASGVADCSLLQRYYGTTAGATLTPAQRTAVDGFAAASTCGRWDAEYGGLLDPADGCDPKIAATAIWSATNPAGVRCTLQDANRNQYGTDPTTGFAVRPLDNVGVQYGLQALNDGAITFDQFLALNDGIGGIDGDGGATPERTSGDPQAIQTAYENGRVSTGVGDQPKVPMLEVDRYDDPTGALTDHVRPFSQRNRLTFGGPVQGVPGLQVWTRDRASTARPGAAVEALAVLDEWLTALTADRDGGSRNQLLERTRPAAALDNCVPPGATEPISGLTVYDDEGPCAEAYPTAATPRMVAGGPISDDVLKCELKALDPLDYAEEPTPEQLARLEATFPEGVCNWNAAGVGQTIPSMSDRSYEDVEVPADLA